uniref:Nibrin n=1 Tax=Scophthalmus maximus TaxID=52904 RepID=A0A8D3CG12_SCOMX
MWILTALQPGGETHYLVASKEYVVGRKNCDILLANDQSISRAHAHLTATDQTLTLKDTSKYGTFVNSQRLTENTSVNLKSGDIVTFGAFHSKFSVEHQKPVVCSSCLDNDGKASLSQALLALGGKLVNSWTQDCTHLVMPSVKVTIKTISALLCCRPIVKPEFFLELNEAAQQKQAPPKAESFIPEIDEPSLIKEEVNVGVMPIRKQLFTEKTFIFLSAKQLKRLSAAVSFGRGKSQLLEEGSLPRDLLESPQSCVVDVTSGSSQTLSSSTTDWANSVKNIIQRKGLRVITESEIGLAAIFASCDKYCNPSAVMQDSESVSKVKPRIPSASLSQNVAVDETVLPASTQNITAYAVNTEPSERYRTDTHQDLIRVVQKSNSSVLSRKTNGGTKTFLQKQSPQKPKIPAQVSPQKQSTLTTFFQPESKIDEDLPKKLVLVEFRSLTVTVPPKTKPKPMLSNSYAKNFKRFRKNRVPGAETSPHIIGGSDLLVHNRGKNTDLDEWLKDAAEEERQSRRDETVGDDLFSFSPKPTIQYSVAKYRL